MNQLLVSIIIPTFNRAHLIGETLDSVLAQTYTNWECIVVDDGSTDATDDLMDAYLKKDSRFQYYHRPKDRLPGGNAARNYGFELSKGEYIHWFDSDDVMEPNKLLFQINLLEYNKKQVCICNSAFFYKKPKDIDSTLLWEMYLVKGGIINTLLTQQSRIPLTSIIWKRNVVQEFKWAESILRGQEWLFNLIVFYELEENDIIFTTKILAWIRKTKDSKSLSETQVNRYIDYLNARVTLLNYFEYNKSFYKNYFGSIYKNSIKYVRVMLNENKFKILVNYSKIICRYSCKSFFYFIIGCLMYKILKSNYFLKKTV